MSLMPLQYLPSKVSNGWSKTQLENVRSGYDHHLKQTAYASPVTFYYGKWWKVYKAWKCKCVMVGEKQKKSNAAAGIIA